MSESGPTPSPRLAELGAYSPPKPLCPIDLRLDGNEGAAPPPALVTELQAELAARLKPYPSPQSLAPSIAKLRGVDPSRVLVTAGADDALDRCCRAVLAPGRSLVMAVPTFEMIERYARLAGADVIGVPWLEGTYPVDAIIESIREDTAMVVIVTPNNPTGLAVSSEDIERIADAAPDALVVVDAAYVEFADEDPTARLQRRANVLVTRTLSKAWGLAGLRVGYALGAPRVLEWLARVGQPYAVSGPSVALAEAWLGRGAPALSGLVDRVRLERKELSALLKMLGAKPLDSQANFVLARFEDAALVRDGLAGLGIAVRIWPGREGLEDALRITCPGDPAAFDRLCAALEAVLKPDALLMDMDGVLADVSSSFREAVRETCARWGVSVSNEEIAAAKSRGGLNNDWDLTRFLLAERGVDRSREEVIEAFEAIYQGSDDVPGLCETESLLADSATIRRLARGRRTAIVTGRPRRDAQAFVERFGLGEAIDAMVCMEDAPNKPDPAPVLLALARLGARRAWMVGDMPDDAKAARAAGVVPIGVLAPGDETETMTDALSRAGAARVLMRITELEEILR